MNTFRKVCRFLHRELGYVAVGLTLVYAISGIAVNHKHSWNENYRITTEYSSIEAVTEGGTDEIIRVVLERLAPVEEVRNTWRATPTEVQVFVEDATYFVNNETGAVRREGFRKRPFFYEVNFLHLNHGQGWWTWVADGYSGILVILALSGIFLVRGRKGLAGRGGILMAMGFAIPVVFLLLQS